MHSHGDKTGGVVALNERPHELIHGYSEVVERLIRVLLQLVAEAPEHHRRRVAVSFHPFGHLFLPVFLKGSASGRVLSRPFVVEFVDNKDAVFVAKLYKLAAIWIVRRADMVHSELFHQQNTLLDGVRIVGSTERSECMMVGIALEQHFLSVELHAKVRTKLYGTDAERRRSLIGHGAVFAQHGDHSLVQKWPFCVPQLRVLHLEVGQLTFHRARLWVPFLRGLSVVDNLSVGVVDADAEVNFFRFGAVRVFCADADVAVVACRNAERMPVEVQILRCRHHFHATEQTSARVPARIAGLARVCHDGQHVFLTEAQLVRNVDFEADVSVIGSSDELTVQVNVTHIHDSSEVDEHASALQAVCRCEMQAVPAAPHLFESSAGEAALDVGGNVGVVGTLVSCWWNPWLFYLEIVRKRQRPPSVVVEVCFFCISDIAELELPSVVQTDGLSCLCLCGHCYEGSGHDGQYSFHVLLCYNRLRVHHSLPDV